MGPPGLRRTHGNSPLATFRRIVIALTASIFDTWEIVSSCVTVLPSILAPYGAGKTERPRDAVSIHASVLIPSCAVYFAWACSQARQRMRADSARTANFFKQSEHCCQRKPESIIFSSPTCEAAPGAPLPLDKGRAYQPAASRQRKSKTEILSLRRAPVL